MAKKLTEAEKLLGEAQKGQELSTDQRRHVVGYLMATQPGMTNLEMSELLQCSDRTIRLDKEWTRKQASELVKEEDVALVISDIRLSYERFVQRLEKSLDKAEPGTRVYLDHLRLSQDMQLKVVDALQSLGWYPKNLGQLTKREYSFKAVVTKDGTVDTRPVDAYDHLITANPQELANDLPQLTDGIPDAEFEEVPSAGREASHFGNEDEQNLTSELPK